MTITEQQANIKVNDSIDLMNTMLLDLRQYPWCKDKTYCAVKHTSIEILAERIESICNEHNN